MNTATNGFYARVALSFARRVDTGLISFVRNVVKLMTKNPQYPTPKPTLAVITASVNGFELKVQAALDGGKIAIAARNAARVELLSLMRQLAAYVQGNCNANLTALLTSGFDAVRAPSPVGVLPAPQNPRLSLTRKSRELLFKFDRVTNAVNYTIQIADSPNGAWKDYDLSTATRVLIEDLTPGQTYWARACANGSAGASEWSAATSAMAI
jgi:hypothetical protein